MPAQTPGSGADVRQRLLAGEVVSWRFTPGERRLVIDLPPELGGGGRVLEICGGYALAAKVPVQAPA